MAMLDLAQEREIRVRLEQTGIQVLLWLLRHPFQRVEDMTVALKVHPATVYRYLAQHEQTGRVESITPALGIRDTCRLYYLSAGGIATCAQVLHADPAQLARFWGVDERGLIRLLPRLHCLIALYTLINGLVKDAPAQLAYPGGSRSTLTWNWILDYDHRFLYRERPSRVAADAVLLFHRSANGRGGETESYYGMWLFLDTGLCGEHDDRLIRQRLEGVLRYRESSERTPAYSQFPPVLVLVQSHRQEAVWQRCAIEAAQSFRGVRALRGAIVTVPRESDYASAWPLAWHELTTNASCHIQDYLEPMVEQAVPPGVLTRPSALGSATAQAKKREALPLGNFARRVKSVSTTVWCDEETERDAVGLLGLHFSRRHMEVLHLLYTHPWLATGELAALCDLEPESATRYLYELRHFSCAQKDTTECGQRWHLTGRGLRLAAASLHFALQHISARGGQKGTTQKETVQRGAELLRSHIHHTAAMYGFFASLYLAARKCKEEGHKMVWFERGALCERRYRDGGEWHNFRPDGALEYRYGGESLFAWVEWDEGTMTSTQLRAKLEAYGHFTRTREWTRDGSVSLPFLYCIVPDKAQFLRLAALARKHLSDCGLTVRITTATRLSEHGPLAAIWHEAVPIGAGNNFVRRHFLDRRDAVPVKADGQGGTP